MKQRAAPTKTGASRRKNLWNRRQVIWNCPVRGEQIKREWKQMKKAHMNYRMPLKETIYALLEIQQEKGGKNEQKTYVRNNGWELTKSRLRYQIPRFWSS